MSHLPRPWGRLWYSDSGDRGPALVFLHGSGCDSADWDATIRCLPPGTRVVCVDFRGHGNSDAPRTAFSLRNLASDVLELLRRRRLRRAVLVGHSLGGMVALDAASRSARVAGLVLLEGWTSLDAAGKGFAAGRFYGTLGPAEIRRVQQKFEAAKARVSLPRWAEFWVTVQRFDALDYLRRAQIPIFEVYGELGRLGDSDRLLRVPRNRHIRWHWIAGAGHYLPHETPATVADICAEAGAASV
ncbi:MAG: hypothetical protein A3K19_13925 [Lentisphaerae bacterium RIFOXYB12_FULL_65_16]|nr:MAG: hypothetical protein A3K18_25925 [Lentisphaerae bacterium RIFOXYA12_64_32]OGV88214.1 MAG: hypothetical protein A3K19_13925 [Lentisphaerae bacterium RIFOXYB12_FULL_65_16]